MDLFAKLILLNVAEFSAYRSTEIIWKLEGRLFYLGVISNLFASKLLCFSYCIPPAVISSVVISFLSPWAPWATAWSSSWQCCLQQGGWNKMIFEDPQMTRVILWFFPWRGMHDYLLGQAGERWWFPVIQHCNSTMSYSWCELVSLLHLIGTHCLLDVDGQMKSPQPAERDTKDGFCAGGSWWTAGAGGVHEAGHWANHTQGFCLSVPAWAGVGADDLQKSLPTSAILGFHWEWQ